MAGLEPLLPLIYHERQQQGSQLCAQHALNAVLQGDYFQAPDLAQFAEQLDHLEGSVNEEIGPSSHNMDDTGFFSVGVLEGALRVWGFALVRWRSQAMRDEQDKPQNQMAFILNHQQHWFALRRFGDLTDPNNGHWFSLNSFLQGPEWVGKLYLGMMLSQAEEEGYSVFAVRPLDEDPEAILPHTEADDVAMTLPQPTSAGMATRLSTSSLHTRPDASQNIPGFEDEDLELQAALQASLVAQDHFDTLTPPSSFADPLSQSSTVRLPGTFPGARDVVDADAAADDVAATMARNQARNKAIIERMKREQEMALRETYEEEVENFGETSGSRRRRTTGENEEEEALRRAIEISRSDTELAPAPYTQDNALGLTSEHRATYDDRVYDDEDSELQAALKASLEGLPDDFVIPSTPPRPTISSSSGLLSPPEASMVEEPARTERQDESNTVEVNAEELRRRRLARFGGN